MGSDPNNEVSAREAERLHADGYRAGDPEWECLGIFEHVTMPRITAAFTGVRPDGKTVEGDYKFTDEFPLANGLEENVEFCELTYESRDQVNLGAAFEAVASLLWLKAGAEGPRIDTVSNPWALPESARYAVLFDPAGWRTFIDAVKGADVVTHAFIVTNSTSVFQQIVRELPTNVEPVRLYENYLSSFEINTGDMS